MNGKPVKVGIVGSQFQADIHAASMVTLEGEIELVAVASPTPGNARILADRYKIPEAYTDYMEIARHPEIEMVTITTPNSTHAEIAIAMANAGKHVVVEKPLCITLAEADAMLEACRRNGVLLMYAEELFFAPKYVQARRMADAGGFGRLHLVKQSEKHFGPHSDWFWDAEKSGGGVLFDMGCHGIAFAYWFFGRPKIKTVYSQMGTYVHGNKTKCEDECITLLEFEGNRLGMIENSWARRGGMDDRVEVFGEGGLTMANLHMGNALQTYSEYGYGYAVEKAPSTVGWSYPVFEELWNYGFPQEFQHFARCVRGRETCDSTGDDGKVVLEAIYAAYASAGLGRKIALPHQPLSTSRRPIDEWLSRKTEA